MRLLGVPQMLNGVTLTTISTTASSRSNYCSGLLSKDEEAHVLEKVRPGEFRWYGFLAPEERDEQGRLLYQIIDPMVANEPAHERPTRN